MPQIDEAILDGALMEFETVPFVVVEGTASQDGAAVAADDATVVGGIVTEKLEVSEEPQDTAVEDSLVSEKDQMGRLELLTTTAVEKAKEMPGVVGQVNWATPSWDIFVVIFSLVAVFLYGLSLGRDRLIVILVSIYITFAVIASAPVDWVFADDFTAKAVAFPILLVVIFFLLTRTSLASVFGRLASGNLWQVFLFSVLHVGMIISLTIYFLPGSAIEGLHPLTQFLFAGNIARLLWVTAPVAALALFTDGD